MYFVYRKVGWEYIYFLHNSDTCKSFTWAESTNTCTLYNNAFPLATTWTSSSSSATYAIECSQIMTYLTSKITNKIIAFGTGSTEVYS